jgi:hypothetical protein
LLIFIQLLGLNYNLSISFHRTGGKTGGFFARTLSVFISVHQKMKIVKTQLIPLVFKLMELR